MAFFAILVVVVLVPVGLLVAATGIRGTTRFLLRVAVCGLLWMVVGAFLAWGVERVAGLPFPDRFGGDPPARYWIVYLVSALLAVWLQGRWQWPDWPKTTKA